MKRKLIVALAMLALVAACGGGSSTSETGGGTTPAPTSSKSVGADLKAMNMAFQAFTAISGQLFGGVGMVVKTTSPDSSVDITIDCSSVDPSSFACTATDSSGGTCNVTGSANEATYVFSMSFDCTNFHPETETSVDGSFTANVTVASSAVAMTTKNVSVLKSTDTGGTGSECAIEDDSTTLEGAGISCTEGGTCSADSSNLIASVDFTVGSRGLKLVDICGTFEYGAGFLMSSNFCMTSGTTALVLNFTANGTMNGTAADFSQTWTCDTSAM